MALAETLKELSNPIKREILQQLKLGKMSAGDISKQFNLSNATISYHLAQLKKADLIRESKYKNFIYYELNTSVFEEVLLWINQIKGDQNENK